MLGRDFFETFIVFLFALSPFLFISGVLILLAQLQKYNKMESVLGKEIGGITKRIAPIIETNIYSFHNRMIRRKVIIGLVCLILSVVLFSFKRQAISIINSIE
jgi:hypothetical protein